jgi:hypothetical protein
LRRASILSLPILALAVGLVLAADVVPTDVQIPGTQPLPTDDVPTINSVGNCGCHDFNGNLHQESTPVRGWEGAMMANAGRDPLFWSTVAIAEQDFLPGGGGVGDLCLHCHSVKGWLEGRSTPTDGSGLDPNTDGEGIMCEFCHLLTNPDEANTIPNPPEGTYHEEQNGDFVAYDEFTGDGYYGGAEYVLNSGGTRLGPYSDHGAKHDAIPSAFHRDARLCGTCHDVSNPAVGDLAPNHGAMAPLPGAFSGVPGAPVADKAAFNNPPATYGIVERTFSEWVSSGLDTLAVNDFGTLPADLQVAGGALQVAYERARWGTCASSGDFCNEDANCDPGEACVTTTADYQDGAVRYFTCQTCHMYATGGDGAQQGRGDPYKGKIRPDLPAHDQTGFSYWVQDVVQYQDANGILVFGGGLTSTQISEMDAAQLRAQDHLESAATVSATQIGNQVQVKVTNLTGHKLISGYPEGRRMWLRLKWENDLDEVLFENGAYGPIGNVVNDLDGDPWDVQSILDPSSTKVYEAEPAMTQDWAAALVSLGYPGTMVLEWNRQDNSPGMTLGELATSPGGSELHTFHFVLNNAVHLDNRIPPYGFQYDEAYARNALPVPVDQYGDPGPGGTYDHFDLVNFPIPPGVTHVDVELLYQTTSWEYIQFLWLQNDGSSAFLANEGLHMMDAWMNTGMSPPLEMASVDVPVTAAAPPPGEPSDPAEAQMQVTAYDGVSGAISLSYFPACDATGHTVHYGALANVSTYGWQDSDCAFDLSGTGSFIPDPAVGDSIFWVIVGHNPTLEGSYGKSSAAVERPPFTTAPALCLRTQDLAVQCE